VLNDVDDLFAVSIAWLCSEAAETEPHRSADPTDLVQDDVDREIVYRYWKRCATLMKLKQGPGWPQLTVRNIDMPGLYCSGFITMKSVQTIKQAVHHLADDLPDHTTWKDVAYEAHVRQKMEAGLAEVRRGDFADERDVRKTFAKWGKSSTEQNLPKQPTHLAQTRLLF